MKDKNLEHGLEGTKKWEVYVWLISLSTQQFFTWDHNLIFEDGRNLA